MLHQYSLVANEYQKPAQFQRCSNQSILTHPGFERSDSKTIYLPDQNNFSYEEKLQQHDVETPSIKAEQHLDFNFSEIDSYPQYKEDQQQCNQLWDTTFSFQQDCESINLANNRKIKQNLSEIKLKKIKKNVEKKNAETKNLPSFFLRLFYKVVDQAQLNNDERKQFIKFETSDSLSKASIKKLKDFIQVPCFKKLIIEYIESYKYLHDVLNSDKIINVTTPIKYLRHIHKACYQPESFNSWAD